MSLFVVVSFAVAVAIVRRLHSFIQLCQWEVGYGCTLRICERGFGLSGFWNLHLLLA